MRRLWPFIALALVILGGFLDFATRVVPRPQEGETPKAQGVVALTGGAARLDAGLRLLGAGCCQRLLITGVNAETSREDLRKRFADQDTAFECCVDLDHAALDTVGNAVETARWARGHHMASLIVVTAAYHMPRSLLLINSAAPEIALTAYPVAAEPIKLGAWWRDPTTLQVLLLEYPKYLVQLIRARLGYRPEPLAPGALNQGF